MHETQPTAMESFSAKNQTEDPKRRPNWKALFFVVLFFGFVLLALFLQSPLSAVSGIDVKGNLQVRYEDIVRTAGIETGMSFWRIDKAEAAEQLMAAYPLIQSADIQVSWTGNVVIAVVEKSVSGIMYQQGKLYSLLQDGTVLDAGEKLEAVHVPLISMDKAAILEPGKKVEAVELIELVKQIPEIERKVLDGISEIRITSEGPWKVYMRDKFEVRIPPLQFADKFKSYEKYRNALGDKATPVIINLLESSYTQPFGKEPEKKGGE